MHLKIDRPVYESIVRAAQRAAPLEACGLCGGRDGRITHVHILTNADASSDHYRLLPEEQFAAVKALRARGADLLALWHSHPATPARMSAEDLRLAFTPDIAYLILSLADPSRPVLRGFTVLDGKAEEIALAILSRTQNEAPIGKSP